MNRPRRSALRPRRLHVLPTLLVAAIVLTGCSSDSAPPNVIVIMVDTLRADYVGAYGFEGDISPNIDALARESIRFDRCISQAPWTSPSVASFFTSLHPQNHCVANTYGLFCEFLADGDPGWYNLAQEAPTLAEVFRESGYDTAGFVGNWVIKSKFGFGQGFETYEEPEGDQRHIEQDGILFDKALRWLEGRNGDGPFLLYLHLMDVHAPYRVTAEDIQALSASPSLGQDRALTDEEIEARPAHLGARIRWPSAAMSRRLRNWKLAYAAGVRRFDRQLGEFLQALRSAGWIDKSVVIFTSDHGEEFLEHGAWEHGETYYNEELHVPLLIRLPGAAKSGTVIDRVVSLIDVMPTLLGLAGVDTALPPMQGTDLGPAISERPADEDVWAFSSALPQQTASLAAQNDRFKLILDLENGKLELYDLVADPGEQRDLAAEREDLVERLRRRVRSHLESLRDYPSYRPAEVPLSDEDIEQLRSLGYVQ